MAEIDYERLLEEEEHKINIEHLKVILKSINFILTKNIHNIKLFKSDIDNNSIDIFINYYNDMKIIILDMINNISTETIKKDSIKLIINYYRCKQNNLIKIDILLKKYYINERRINTIKNNNLKDILPIFEIVKLICNIDSIYSIIESEGMYSINYNYDYPNILSDYKELYNEKFNIFNDMIKLIQ